MNSLRLICSLLTFLSQAGVEVLSENCRAAGEICSVGKHCCTGLRCDPSTVKQNDAFWGYCTAGHGAALAFGNDTSVAPINPIETQSTGQMENGLSSDMQNVASRQLITTSPSTVSSMDDIGETFVQDISPELNAYMDTGERAICGTDVCKDTADKMLAAMDSSVDPCDDFYTYACGNWIETHPVPDNQTAVTRFTEMANQARLAVQDMLGSKKRSTFRSEAKAKAIFKQCLNQEETEQLRARPLLDLLNEQIGGWPVITPNWNASNFDIFQALSRLRIHGDEPFFSVSVYQSRDSVADNHIDVSLPGMFASQKLLNNSDAGKLYVDGYVTYLTKVTSLLLRDSGNKRFVNDPQIVCELTSLMDLKRIMATVQGGSPVSLTGRKNTTFPESSIFRNLTAFIQSIFEPVELSDSITAKTKISLADTTYFDYLDKQLAVLERCGDAGKRQIANYIGWSVITRNMPLLSKEYRDALEEYNQKIYGEKTMQQHSTLERCASDVVANLPLTVGAMYVRDYVSMDLRPKVSIMIADVKLGFGELLGGALSTWMDNHTYTAAVKKLNAMAMFPGYPNLLTEGLPVIDNEYKEMDLGFNYFMTTQQMRKLKNYKNLEKLKGKKLRYNPISDYADITTANAYNALAKNLIIVLASILHPPFYQPDNPHYVNYGGIGSVIGHEITHGFDNQGRYYDETGQYRSWWSTATGNSYNTRKDTLVDQYNGFRTSVGPVNGTLTLPENIADNGGIKAAYRAYFNHYAPQLMYPEALLPGFFNTTAEQLFFLSAAQVWCAAKRPEVERIQQLTDPHSPNRFRVLTPMSNMPEFASAYSCPLGSKMNPAQRRAVW